MIIQQLFNFIIHFLFVIAFYFKLKPSFETSIAPPPIFCFYNTAGLWERSPSIFSCHTTHWSSLKWGSLKGSLVWSVTPKNGGLPPKPIVVMKAEDRWRYKRCNCFHCKRAITIFFAKEDRITMNYCQEFVLHGPTQIQMIMVYYGRVHSQFSYWLTLWEGCKTLQTSLEFKIVDLTLSLYFSNMFLVHIKMQSNKIVTYTLI